MLPYQEYTHFYETSIHLVRQLIPFWNEKPMEIHRLDNYKQAMVF